MVEHEVATSKGGVRKRQVLQHPGAAIILPLLPPATGGGSNEPRVVLIRNQRVAVGKTLVELPAGTLEPTEPPLEAARRELTEETGYTALRWAEMPGFFMSPGILSERMHCFLAEELSEGEPRREAGEEIENLVVPLAEALAMIKRGEIEDAKTIAVLLYFESFMR